MSPKERFPVRYELTRYAGPAGEIDTRTLTPEDLSATDIQAFDHALDLASGAYGYRNAEGDWIKQPLDGSGLGKTCIAILQVLQLYPGVFITPRELAELTGNWNLSEPGVLAARVRAIRAAHGENGERPRFILSRRANGYALMWPAELTWIWIERVIKSAE